MNHDSARISQANLLSVRNNLAHIYRFGGICTALKFNPSNISNEESKRISSAIINSLNETLWERGVDVISTSYNNGGVGFMLVTTSENKEQIKLVLENLSISKSLKNEYVVSVGDILSLSDVSKPEFNSTSYLMTIYDTYKITTNNQFSLSLNEEAHTSSEVQICERTLNTHLRKLGLLKDGETDQGFLELLNEFGSKFADQTKKYVVPALLVVALFYTCQFLYKKYAALKAEKDAAQVQASESRDLDVVDNGVETNAFGPFEPFAPFEPNEPSDFNVVLGARSTGSGNQRLSSLLRTLEDSDVKQAKTNNIESKILSLLAETTTSH